MNRLLRKLRETWALLRYGPTRLRALDEGLARNYELHTHAATSAAQLQRQVETAREQSQAEAARVQSALVALQASVDASARELAAARDQLRVALAALDRVAVQAPAGAAVPGAAAVEVLEAGFYPLLELHFRGAEADVRARLLPYRAAVDASPPGRFADLGCGRGEWLGLLREWGREAVGVDSNPAFVQALGERGLAVEAGDAVQWLQRQPAASLAGLSAFHLAEHLPFGVLLRLLHEAARVLVPGGLLIVETPNPENLEVATQTFWLDPTHLRPLPPALLQLAFQSAGLAQLELLRLNPPGDGQGAARDYAVLGRRGAAA